LGVRREFIHQSRHLLSQNALNPALDSEVQVRFWGCQDANDVEAEGTKTMSRKE
jgi:hypothetical protein